MLGSLWNRSFVCCLFLQAIYMLSFNMATPLVAEYVEFLGGTTSLAGLIAGMFSFLALVYRPFVGVLADRSNRTKLMLIGSVIGAISIAGYGLSSECYMVAVFRVFHAFALCIQTTLVSVVATSFVPKERIAEGVGYVGVAAMLGMSLGPGFGVIVARECGHSAAFFFAALLMAVSAFLISFLPSSNVPRKTKRQKGTRANLNSIFDLKSFPLAVSAASFAYCAGLTTSFLVLIGASREIDHIAIFYFISSVGMVVTRPISGRYADRQGIRMLCFIAFSAEAICMICLSAANSLCLIVVASLFRALGQGIGQATIQGQVLRDSSLEERGKACSTFYLGVDAGQGAGAIVGGVLADAFGFSFALLSALPALLLGLVAFAFWLGGRKSKLEK